MSLFLFGLAMAGGADGTIDWAEYDAMSRSVCRAVRTKEEYGALAAAQLVLMAHAQVAVVTSQERLSHLGWLAHHALEGADAGVERNALAAVATIEFAQEALRAEQAFLGEWTDRMEFEARTYLRAVTPRNFPRRSLRLRCNDAFRETRRRVQHTVDLLLAQNAAVSTVLADRIP